MRNSVVSRAKQSVGRCAILAVAFGVVTLGAVKTEASVDFELGGYTVSGLNTDPGLVIQTADLLSKPHSFSGLSIGTPVSVDLFRIWTDEAVINIDDLVPQNISVAFNFTMPSFNGLSTGSTSGTAGFWVLGTSGAGVVEWNNPLVLNFGSGGQLQITLSNQTFNAGSGLFNYSFPLTPGYTHGATVTATFELLQEPAAGPGGAGPSAPEASSAIVWSLLLCAAGSVAIYKRRSAAVQHCVGAL